MHDPDNPAQLQARITELETLFTHLQRAVHDLDQEIIEQDRQRHGLIRRVEQLEREIQSLRQGREETSAE